MLMKSHLPKQSGEETLQGRMEKKIEEMMFITEMDATNHIKRLVCLACIVVTR